MKSVLQSKTMNLNKKKQKENIYWNMADVERIKIVFLPELE